MYEINLQLFLIIHRVTVEWETAQSCFFQFKTWKWHQKALKLCSGNPNLKHSGNSQSRDTIPLTRATSLYFWNNVNFPPHNDFTELFTVLSGKMHPHLKRCKGTVQQELTGVLKGLCHQIRITWKWYCCKEYGHETLDIKKFFKWTFNF